MVSVREDLDLKIKMLGPLIMECDGRDCTPTAPKLRNTLAVLAMNAGHLVPFSVLAQELWDERLPHSASTTLQTYILQLRKLLSRSLHVNDGAAREILLTRPGGYVLDVNPDSSDFSLFERLSTAGRRVLAMGDAAQASTLLREALDLWRGPALVDVAAGPVLEPRICGLKELRLVTLEYRIEAELRIGAHREVLSELAVLTTQFRYNENLHAQYMIALHRAGRRNEALDVFRQLRERLIDELGLEPSRRLREFQQAVLTSEADVTYSAF
jgi:DNA-binding SARP family transcriptional activator